MRHFVRKMTAGRRIACEGRTQGWVFKHASYFMEMNMLVKMSAKEINDIWLRNVVATVNLTFTGMKDDKT